MNTKKLIKHTLLLVLIGMGVSAWAVAMAESWEKMVFHVDDTANARWALLLANSYLDDSSDARIVIVTYGPGVNFLLEDAEDRRGNPYDPAVINLAKRGVDFRICAITLDAKDIPKDEVLDVAKIVPSGLAEIARLQIKEGYAYLKP